MKRILTALLIAVLITGSLSGCAASGGAAAAENENAAAGDSASAAEDESTAEDAAGDIAAAENENAAAGDSAAAENESAAAGDSAAAENESAAAEDAGASSADAQEAQTISAPGQEGKADAPGQEGSPDAPGQEGKADAPGQEGRADAAAAKILSEAAEKSLIPNRLLENENILLSTLLFSESGSVAESLFLASKDALTSIKYLDNTIITFDSLIEGELRHAGLNEDGVMKINDFIYADMDHCKEWTVKKQMEGSLTPLAAETVTGSAAKDGLTLVKTQITDPETVNAVLKTAMPTAFIYRENSKIVKTYSISDEGFITALATDYVLKDGTVLPHSRTEVESNSDQTFPFPYEELNAGIDPNVTREITLVFYPGTAESFTITKTLPQHMNMTPVLPGETSYKIYVDEACTELFPGSDGTPDLTLYIVPDMPLPASQVSAGAEGAVEISDIYGDIETAGDVTAENVTRFLTLLSQNLILNRVANGERLTLKGVYTGSDGSSSTLEAGFAADGHYAVTSSGGVLTRASSFAGSVMTSGQAGEAITCQLYEADSSWQLNMEQNETTYNFAPVTGERLTSVTAEGGLIKAVTELSDQEGIKALTSSALRGNGMTYTYREGDVFVTTFTFEEESGDFISLSTRLINADGNENTFCALTFETGAEVGAFVFPYAALSADVDPSVTRTVTMVFDPGEEEHFSISRSVPQHVAIRLSIDRAGYTVYADEACSQIYDSAGDNLTDDVTIYIR